MTLVRTYIFRSLKACSWFNVTHDVLFIISIILIVYTVTSTSYNTVEIDRLTNLAKRRVDRARTQEDISYYRTLISDDINLLKFSSNQDNISYIESLTNNQLQNIGAINIVIKLDTDIFKSRVHVFGVHTHFDVSTDQIISAISQLELSKPRPFIVAIKLDGVDVPQTGVVHVDAKLEYYELRLNEIVDKK